MADPVQIRAKEKRLAEALRANLKRRKQRTRDAEPAGDAPHDPTPVFPNPPDDRK